jgi:hypothetical protein
MPLEGTEPRAAFALMDPLTLNPSYTLAAAPTIRASKSIV